MQLINSALKRVHATIVKESRGPKSALFLLRVAVDHPQGWVDTVTNTLLGAAGKPYKFDISKVFYASEGAVRYLWRVKIDSSEVEEGEGTVTEAIAMWASSALGASMSNREELTSFPLVGRAEYVLDPARGRLKGAHGLDVAPQYLGFALAQGMHLQ